MHTPNQKAEPDANSHRMAAWRPSCLHPPQLAGPWTRSPRAGRLEGTAVPSRLGQREHGRGPSTQFRTSKAVIIRRSAVPPPTSRERPFARTGYVIRRSPRGVGRDVLPGKRRSFQTWRPPAAMVALAKGADGNGLNPRTSCRSPARANDSQGDVAVTPVGGRGGDSRASDRTGRQPRAGTSLTSKRRITSCTHHVPGRGSQPSPSIAPIGRMMAMLTT